jgi:hypothetical protein
MEYNENTYLPYCKECDACGEEGCCSALVCKQSEKGDYCKGYLRDLRFGYQMYRDLMEIVSEDPKYKEQIDKIWDENYERFYKKDL